MKNDMEDEDLDLDIELEEKSYEYFEQEVAKRVQHYYLSGAITVPTKYTAMIHNISTAPITDTIVIHLNTYGGDLATGIQLVNAMKFTEAHVICSLEAEAFSVGSMIFLAGDEFLIHDNSRMMIHNFSGGTYGKGNEQVSKLESDIKWFKTLANDYYIPFITAQELVGILRGEDLWLQTPDIRKRLTKMVKTIKKQRKIKG